LEGEEGWMHNRARLVVGSFLTGLTAILPRCLNKM
jgi:deoxyribodipyrimidine photolyase